MNSYISLEEELVELIFNTNENKDNLKEIEELIEDGANINYVFYNKYSECAETMLSSAIIQMCISDTGKIVDYYAEVAEILLSYNATFHYCDVTCGYTALDYLILYAGEDGLNQKTYRLTKIMITSLNETDIKYYLKHFRNRKTFHGLIKIFEEFNRYYKYLQYMF